MRFIHISDIHLGKTLQNNPGRYRDYFDVFDFVIELAVKMKIDALVIAGDLFHRGNVDPTVLADTVTILGKLKAAEIPVVAIEGNHDRYQRRKDESWLLYLARRGYLHLLRPTEDAARGEVRCEAYDSERGWGGWIDVAGVRFAGLGYWASSVAKQLERMAPKLPDDCQVALLHAGVWDNPLMDLGRVTTDEIRPMAEYFDYVALGHGHRQYTVTDKNGRVFAYNPGSLEVVNREEARLTGVDEGNACLVEINGGLSSVEMIKIPRRPYLNLDLDIEGCSSAQEAMDTIHNSLKPLAEKAVKNKPPVVMLDVSGRVGFDPKGLEVEKVEETLKELFNPVVCQVNNRASLVRRGGKSGSKTGDLDAIYREAVGKLVEESRWGEKPESVVDIIYRVFEQTGTPGGPDDEQMIDLIHATRMKLEEEDSDE